MHKMAVGLSAVAGVWISCYMFDDTDRDIFQISGYTSIYRNVKGKCEMKAFESHPMNN
jgi:hypothetical protein